MKNAVQSVDRLNGLHTLRSLLLLLRLLFTSITVVAVVLCVCLCLCVPVREQTLRKDNKNILSAFLSRGAMDQSVKC